MIGEDYGMNIENNYDEYIDNVVDRFYFDVDDFKEKLINAIVNGIKIDFKLK